MKNIRSFITGFILAVALIVTVQTSANFATFKDAVETAITANFPAGQQTRIADSFVTAYQNEWTARTTRPVNPVPDNANQRRKFAADKIGDYVQEIVKSEKIKADQAAVPTPTPLP